jgi:hypothetical protein
MPTIAPYLLRPVRQQRYRVLGDGPSTTPRPYDAPQGHAPGVNPDRVLVFGNGIAVGWGVGTHDLALPGQLARALADRTGRGADVDLLAETTWDIDSAADVIRGRDLTGYDAIVVVIGASDAYRLVPTRRWTAGLVRLLDTLENETSPATGITIMGIQPVSTIPHFACRPGGASDGWAEHLNLLTLAICEGRPRVHYLDAPAGVAPLPFQKGPTRDDHRYRSPRRFAEWAETQAAFIAPYLDVQSDASRPARAARDRPQSPERRLATLWELNLLDTPREKRFDDIVKHAQQVFGTFGAAFSVLDERRQWNKSIVGVTVAELPLEDSFCRTTVAHSVPFVVEDAWSDERAPKNATMRFYAGYPVEAADGTRIGALCVFDQAPRDADSVDLTALRDLALAIQRELSVVVA